MPESLIFSLNIMLYATAFFLGFIVGRITSPQSIKNIRVEDREPQYIASKSSFSNPEIHQKRVVSIDESKFVTNITAETLTKKGVELGTQITVEDDVEASVSRLAQLKKNR